MNSGGTLFLPYVSRLSCGRCFPSFHLYWLHLITASSLARPALSLPVSILTMPGCESLVESIGMLLTFWPQFAFSSSSGLSCPSYQK